MVSPLSLHLVILSTAQQILPCSVPEWSHPSSRSERGQVYVTSVSALDEVWAVHLLSDKVLRSWTPHKRKQEEMWAVATERQDFQGSHIL